MAKITSNEYVKVAWILDGSITTAQAQYPTTAQLNAAVDLTQAIAWQDFELGASDSDDIDDRSIVDPANYQTRGFANFSATLSFFRDANLADSTSPYVTAWNTFKTPRTYGYLVMRVAEKKWSNAWAGGDRISVFRMIADTVVDDATGDDTVKFTVNFLPQGILYPYTFVGGAGTITGVPGTNTLTVGASKVLSPVIASKQARAQCTFSSSDTTKCRVSQNGVITGVAAGSATITVNHPAATAAVTQTVTVS